MEKPYLFLVLLITIFIAIYIIYDATKLKDKRSQLVQKAIRIEKQVVDRILSDDEILEDVITDAAPFAFESERITQGDVFW